MKFLSIKKNRGFTLIELLVVIAIIAVLAVSIITALNSARQAARDSKRREHIRNLVSAMELYVNEDPTVPGEVPSELKDALVDGDYATILEFPLDPVNEGDYVYRYSTDGSMSYTFCATLERTDTIVKGTNGNVVEEEGGTCDGISLENIN